MVPSSNNVYPQHASTTSGFYDPTLPPMGTPQLQQPAPTPLGIQYSDLLPMGTPQQPASTTSGFDDPPLPSVGTPQFQQPAPTPPEIQYSYMPPLFEPPAPATMEFSSNNIYQQPPSAAAEIQYPLLPPVDTPMSQEPALTVSGIPHPTFASPNLTLASQMAGMAQMISATKTANEKGKRAIYPSLPSFDEHVALSSQAKDYLLSTATSKLPFVNPDAAAKFSFDTSGITGRKSLAKALGNDAAGRGSTAPMSSQTHSQPLGPPPPQLQSATAVLPEIPSQPTTVRDSTSEQVTLAHERATMRGTWTRSREIGPGVHTITHTHRVAGPLNFSVFTFEGDPSTALYFLPGKWYKIKIRINLGRVLELRVPNLSLETLSVSGLSPEQAYPRAHIARDRKI